MFQERLNRVMEILNINNRQLAEAIFVDPSLVSRWRKGTRTPSANGSYINAMCRFFVQRISAPYQRMALYQSMELKEDVAGHSGADLESLLFSWLMQRDLTAAEKGGSRYIDHLLGWIDQVDATYYSRAQLVPFELHSGEIKEEELFYGEEGIKQAWLRLIDLMLTTKRAPVLYYYSDQSSSWIDNDSDYSELWCSLIRRCLEENIRVKVVHATNSDPQTLFSTLERWIPLYMTLQVESYYCPRNIDSMFRRTLVVAPGCGYIVSNTLSGTEANATYHFGTDMSQQERWLSQFKSFLEACRPLAQFFTPKTVEAAQKLHLFYVRQPENHIAVLYDLSSVTMTEEIFAAGVYKMRVSAQSRLEAMALYRIKINIFRQSLKKYHYSEIIYLPSPMQMDPGKMHMCFVPYFGRQSVPYTWELYRAHIANMIHLLETEPNYHVYLMNSLPLRNVQFMVKERVGVIFSRNYSPFLLISLTQPNLVSVVYNYAENIIKNMSPEDRDRECVIEQLSAYLGK